MKKVLLSILISAVSFLSITNAQTDTLIYSLRGIEDAEGNTHLFYRAKYISLSDTADTTLDFIYTFNESDKKEKPFLNGYSITYYPENHTEKNIIGGIDFIGNNPEKYIYLRNSLSIDGNWSLSRYDTNNILSDGLISANGLYVSKQDTNTVFVVAGRTIYKSVDGGFSVADIYQINFDYLTFSPFNDSIIFGVADDGSLVKSFDQGNSFLTVDQSIDWNYVDTLLFDKDGQHIYAIYNEYHKEYKYPETTAKILVSAEQGNPYTWKVIKELYNHSSICIDDSVPGTIFYATANEIFKSTDFGATFNHYAYVENFPVAIYKKPGKDFLFTANTYAISKVTPDSVENLLRKSIKQSLTYFPIEVGNKWVYYSWGISYDINPNPFSKYYTVEVQKDSIFPDGKKYYYITNIISDNNLWVRLDSSTGKLFVFSGGELLMENFLSTSGDQFETTGGIMIDVVDSSAFVWNEKRLIKTFNYSSLYTYRKSYAQGIGIIRKDNEFDFGYSTDTLKGCVINGVVYGDTTITGIEEIKNEIPQRFVLYQNYPNPFNPTTTIKYALTPALSLGERVSAGRVRGLYVTLKVYDILGREVATLVNEKQSPGTYTVTFDAKSTAGGLPSGIYFYRLKAGNFSETKKMILLR